MTDSLGLKRTRRQKNQRFYTLLIGLTMLGLATALVLNALEDSIVFFYSPSDLRERNISSEQRIRVGGLVELGSWKKAKSETAHEFTVTDGKNKITAMFYGILPDLFREGQGVIAEGRLKNEGLFIAEEVLAKHDEKYMPREVADALKKSGHWNQNAGSSKSPEELK